MNDPTRPAPSFKSDLSTAMKRGSLSVVAIFLVWLLVDALTPAPVFRLTLTMNATTGSIGEVFYSGAREGPSPERAVPFQLLEGWQTYKLNLPSRNGLRTLRLDPGSDRGSVGILELRLERGPRTVALIGDGRVGKVLVRHALERTPSKDVGVHFTATDVDPFVEFQIPAWFGQEVPAWQRAAKFALRWGLVVVGLSLLASRGLRRSPVGARRLSTLLTRLRERASARLLWSCLALPPLAGWLWAKAHMLPRVMSVSLTAALLTTLVAGAIAQRIVDGFRGDAGAAKEPPGIFQLLWLGQYLLFALSLAISPLTALLADWTGIRLPYLYSLPSLLALLALLCVVRRRATAPRFAWPRASSAPFAALVGFAVYRAMTLHSRHAGALGHDTQQHMYWAQHIADYGYLALSARGTDLIDYYPKFFHLLTVCWSSAGFTSIVGPYMKVLPALEVALACGFFGELLLRWPGRSAHGSATRGVLGTVLGGFLVWHLTFGDGQQIYDGNDLSGTPRLASAWVLFGLPLLLLAHRLGTLRDGRAWLLGAALVSPVLALGVNPVLIPVYFTYTLPVALLLAWFTRERGATRTPIRWGTVLAWSGFVCAFAAFSNAFVLDKLSHNAFGARVLVALGLRAAAAGIPDPNGAQTPAPLCTEPALSCFGRLAEEAVSDGARGYVDSLLHANMPAFGSGQYAYVYWLVFSLPLVLLAVWTVRGREPETGPAGRGAQLLLSILAASALPSVLHPMLSSGFAKLAHQGSAFWILHGYYGALHMMLGTWVRCFVPLASWAFVPALALRRRVAVGVWMATASVALIALSSFEIPSLVSHRNARWPWAIEWPELRALRHLDAFVPSHETVVVPASRVVVLNNEHILMASDPVGIAAVHLSSRLLFLVRMSLAADYNWPDLEQNFCADPARRSALLRKVNARWVLVRELNPLAPEVLDRDLWRCGTTLRTLGAESPPAWSERDLALYRINP